MELKLNKEEIVTAIEFWLKAAGMAPIDISLRGVESGEVYAEALLEAKRPCDVFQPVVAPHSVEDINRLVSKAMGQPTNLQWMERG